MKLAFLHKHVIVSIKFCAECRIFRKNFLFLPFLSLMLTGCLANQRDNECPKDFIFLSTVDPTIIESSRYATGENVLSRSVNGYLHTKIVCTKAAALALKNVNEELKKKGYKLVVYDGYRPQRAVDDFIKWSEDHDQTNKKLYYPNIEKKDLFEQGYIAKKSGHSRGSTFDLTIIPLDTKVQGSPAIECRMLKNRETIYFLNDGTIDMGSSFDLFDPVSHHGSDLIEPKQLLMRNFLKDIMEQHGFKAFEKEWWHYTFKKEPYPETYFDCILHNDIHLPSLTRSP